MPTRIAFGALLLFSLAGPNPSRGSENVPYRPFAQLADVPAKGQFIIGGIYEESEAYRIWTPREQHNITVEKGGEDYGIDINQGFLAVQYGLTRQWALDLEVGYTSIGTRSFSEDNSVEKTSGMMDIAFGARYQLFSEAEAESKWIPTLTFRAGAVIPGTFDKDFPFAPGQRSAAIQPEFLARKHFGWTGFGAYGDAFYRWNRTTGNDQYSTTIGLFQQIKGWELAAGYRHMQTIAGSDIKFDPDLPSEIDYPRAVREINDSIEAGFSYTTSKRHLRYGFHTRTVIDGSNTDRKFWIGASFDIPLGGKN